MSHIQYPPGKNNIFEFNSILVVDFTLLFQFAIKYARMQSWRFLILHQFSPMTFHMSVKNYFWSTFNTACATYLNTF